MAIARATRSGRFFVNFTNPAGHTVVARFRRSANPLVADTASRFDLRWGGGAGVHRAAVLRTTTAATWHSGRTGTSTSGMGDGGSGNDPDHRAQNLQELLGKMLRIDVNVPDTRPDRLSHPGRQPVRRRRRRGPEIWSIGLRNPVAVSASTTRRAAAPARW